MRQRVVQRQAQALAKESRLMKSFDRDAGGFSRENLRKDEDGANAVVAACRAMKEEAMALHDACESDGHQWYWGQARRGRVSTAWHSAKWRIIGSLFQFKLETVGDSRPRGSPGRKSRKRIKKKLPKAHPWTCQTASVVGNLTPNPLITKGPCVLKLR